MSRDSQYAPIRFRQAAAAAGTVTSYYSVPTVFLAEGWTFMYETAEPNTDNTVTVALSYTVDGTNFTTIKAVNTNTAGLLDSAAPLVVVRNPTNPGSAAATWGAAADMTDVRVPEKATIRCVVITAGTGTVPAIEIQLYGKFIKVAQES